MAWIESHQELARHPKTLRCAHELGISTATAIGHLHLLWWWSLDYAADGDLSAFTAGELARAADWRGAAEKFVGALTFAGFIDVARDGHDVTLHDWGDYAGKLVDRRAANAARMRDARARARAPEVLGYRTGPDRTVPDRTVPGGTRARERPPKEQIDSDFEDELVVEFAPLLGGEDRARAAITKALNHPASLGIDRNQGLRDWLREDAERYAAREETRNGTTRRRSGQTPADDGLTAAERADIAKYDRIRQLVDAEALGSGADAAPPTDGAG